MSEELPQESENEQRNSRLNLEEQALLVFFGLISLLLAIQLVQGHDPAGELIAMLSGIVTYYIARRPKEPPTK